MCLAEYLDLWRLAQPEVTGVEASHYLEMIQLPPNWMCVAIKLRWECTTRHEITNAKTVNFPQIISRLFAQWAMDVIPPPTYVDGVHFMPISELGTKQFVPIHKETTPITGLTKPQRRNFGQDFARKDGKGKRKVGSLNEGGSSKKKKPWMGNQKNKKQQPQTVIKPMYPKCHKPHLGECKKGTNMCYMCSQPGHFAKACPKLRENRGMLQLSNQETLAGVITSDNFSILA